MHELIVLALVVPLVVGLLSLLQKKAVVLKWINLVGSAAVTSILFVMVYRIIQGQIYSTEFFYLDHLSAIMLFVVGFLTFTATLFSLPYMEKEVKEGQVSPAMLSRYYALFQLFSFAMISVLVVGNMGLMWVAVEGTTLASALLVAFYFNRDALEAAWKYVMICTVGICLALFGTMILYYAQVMTGNMDSSLGYVVLKGIAPQMDPGIVKIAFIFILIGYGTKAGLAPMHTWLPDAHSQAPSPISGLLSGALLSCALYVLARNLIIVQESVGTQYPQYLLLGFGGLSILTALPFVLAQHDVKRLLAYSSVEHMGVITLGLGVGTPLAIYASLLHIVNHAIAKSALFYMAGVITQKYSTRKMDQITGIARVMPLVATLFILAVLAISGSPPFNIFISEFMIIAALFGNHQWLIGGLVLLLLTGIFAGMVRYALKMNFGAAPTETKPGGIGAAAMAAMLVSMAILIIGGFYLPSLADGVLRQAAEIVMGG